MIDTLPDTAVVKVARDLTEIATCYAELHAQAVANGSNPDMPGGAAMVALGPVANLQHWAQLNDLTEAYQDHPDERLRRVYTSVEDEDDDDRWPPHQVIAYWAGRWRAQRGEDYADLQRTGTTELNYVRQMLGWAAAAEPQWATFADDIRQARLRAENLVHAGRRADRTRVVCDRDHCEKHPRLVRAYSPRYLVGWACRACETPTPAEYRCAERNHLVPATGEPCTRLVGPKGARTACGSKPVVVTERPAACCNTRCPSFEPPAEVWASDPGRDVWKCPSCRHRYTPRDFQRAHAKMLYSSEAGRWVRLQEAVSTLISQGRGERTIRRWLAPHRELVDRCLECAAIHPHDEYPACPAEVDEHHGEEPVVCGGILEPRWWGDAEAVIEGICDIATHTTFVWWPDLWRLHLTTRTTPRDRVTHDGRIGA